MSISFHLNLPEKKEMLVATAASRNELLKELLSTPAVAHELLPNLRLVTLSVRTGRQDRARLFPARFDSLRSVDHGRRDDDGNHDGGSRGSGGNFIDSRQRNFQAMELGFDRRQRSSA